MPFHFKKSETPAKAFRRVGGERVRVALKWLGKSRRPVAIHNVRKEIKKLRALLRLVRGGIGDDNFRKAVRRLRRAADRLAKSRDARVIFRALEGLAEDSDKRFPKLYTFLRKHWRRETRQLREGNALREAEQFLKKSGQRLRKLELKLSGWPAVEPGLRQSFEQGQESFGQAVREASPENFHAWRKHVKNLWYQFQLLGPAWRAATQDMVNKLELLGETLGEDHDLVLLTQFVADHCAEETAEVTPLGKLIEARQKKLRTAAVEMGRWLYAETPAAVCRRLETEWNDWRSG